MILEDGEKTGPAHVQVSSLSGKGAWLRVVMTEGRKRQIREIGKTIGLPIVRLISVRIGTLELGDLKSGEYKQLNENQVKSLRALVSGKPRAEKQAAAYAKLSKQEKFRKPGEQKKTYKPGRTDRKNTEKDTEYSNGKRNTDRSSASNYKTRKTDREDRKKVITKKKVM